MLLYAFSVGMSVFVFVCVVPPTAGLPNRISTPRVASRQKIQRIATIETSKQTGSEITDSTLPKKPHPPSKSSMTRYILNMDKTTHHFTLQGSLANIVSCTLLLLNLATRVNFESDGREKQRSPILWIWTAVPILTTSCQYYIQHL